MITENLTLAKIAVKITEFMEIDKEINMSEIFTMAENDEEIKFIYAVNGEINNSGKEFIFNFIIEQLQLYTIYKKEKVEKLLNLIADKDEFYKKQAVYYKTRELTSNFKIYNNNMSTILKDFNIINNPEPFNKLTTSYELTLLIQDGYAKNNTRIKYLYNYLNKAE